MSVPFETLTDRQKRLVEARLLANEDAEFRHRSLRWIAKDRRGWALYKDRWALALAGGAGRESGWDVDCMPIVDFGHLNAAGATTIRSGFNTFPLVNPAHALGSIDPEPYELGTLAAASGDRQIGSSTGSIVILLGIYLVHITSAAAVYNSATASILVRVVNTVTTVGGAFTTLGTLAWTAGNAPNFVDQIPIVAPTGRHVSVTGTDLTNIAAIFNGDSIFCELSTGGALNVQSNILYVMLELA